MEIDDVYLSALLRGETLTREQALNIPAVAACVKLVTEAVAGLPLLLYSEKGGGVKPLTDPRVELLNDSTGDLMNGAQLKAALVRDYLLDGAGYAYLNRRRNDLLSIHYVKREQVSVVLNQDPIFKQAQIWVQGKPYGDFEFLKLLQNTRDGVTGQGIVGLCNQMLQSAYALLKHELVMSRTGGNKKGFLQSKSKLAPEALAALRSAWKKMYGSAEASDGMIILNDGVQFQDAGATAVEMQLIELKNANTAAVCSLVGVPPAMLLGEPVSEETNRQFVKNAVGPVLVAFEAACDRDVLLEREKGVSYWAFDTKELLKGDMKSRFEAYQIGVKNGFMQIDEARYQENLAPLGLNFIKLGLQDVLYDPETNTIYTPNTDKTAYVKAAKRKGVESTVGNTDQG